MEINLLEHQAEFISSTVRHTGLVGGFRSGKSHAGVWKSITKKVAMPGIDVAYYLPTYPLIKDIAFPKFAEALDSINMQYTINKSDKDIITPYGRIICRSMDNPDTIIGYEVGYSLIDEADVIATDKMQNAMIKILARNSVVTPDGINATDFVSTPEGFKFLYKFFVKEATENKHLIKANTRDNPFISESYVQSLMDEYTPELLQAYLDGEFVNLTSGNVYRNFDREENHSDRVVKENDVLHIGMDFNITKMSAIVHVIDGNIKIAVDEFTDVYDTSEMIETIKKKYGNHSIVIYPDASGSNRKSNGKSDIQLLKDARFTIRKSSKNPFVRDRVNAMNLAFCNSKEERTYLVNTNNCPRYTESLEQQPYKNGEPDKQGGFDHTNDAGGYFIVKINKSKYTTARAR